MSDPGARLPGASTLGAFGLAVTLGAGNFLAVRFSNQELPPFWGAGLRFGLAAVLFVAIALMMRLPWPRGRRLALTAAFGTLAIGIFYALMYWALVRVTAGVGTIVMAVVPLTTMLLAAAQRLERMHIRGLLGAVLALLGIIWMTVGPEDVVLPLTALAAMLLAAVAVGQSIIVGKRVSDHHPVVVNAVGMTVGAALLLGLSAAMGETWALPRQSASMWSVLYLVTAGSVGLFVLVLLVVRRWTPSATSYMFVLFPVVTMLLEAWLAEEPITVPALVGAALVMLGVWTGALSPAARRAVGAAVGAAVGEVAEPLTPPRPSWR